MAGLLDGLLNGNSSGDGSGLLSFLNSLGMGPGMPPADPSASFADRFGAATPPALGAPPASIVGMNSPTGTMPAAQPPASFADRFGAAPSAFGAGAAPIFATPAGVPGNPSLQAPQAAAPPIVAQGSSEDDDAPATPIKIGGYQMPRIGSADDFTPDPAALPANSQPTQGQIAPAAPAAAPDATPGIGQRVGAALNSLGAPDSLFRNMVSNPVNAFITGQTPESKQTQIANQTARALVAKGVDPQMAIAAVQPGNTEMLKTLIDNAFKSKDPMNLGNGYVLRPGADKAERLFTPDDKTPTSALEYNYYKDNLPPGQKPMDYATFSDAKSRVEAQNPNKNQTLGRGGEIIHNNPDGTVTVVHKNESEQPAPMDPASLEILARREIGGDFSGRKNLGRGAQGAADLKAITNKSADILTNEMGMTPTEAAAHLVKKQQEYVAQGQGLNAEARTTGVREANLNLILKAADAAIPAALEASDKVSRTGFVPLNKIIQNGEVMTSDPDLKKFGMANLQLAEHWARAMNPTGVLRESDRDKALSYLSTADSNETYKAAVGQLRTQIERERDAVKATRGMSDLPGSAAAPTPGAAAAATASPAAVEAEMKRRGLLK